MARKRKKTKTQFVYPDYRPGHAGEFTSKEVYNRSKGQGVYRHIKKESIPSRKIVSSARDLFDYEDYDYDWPEYEYHGTGDTGKSKGK